METVLTVKRKESRESFEVLGDDVLIHAGQRKAKETSFKQSFSSSYLTASHMVIPAISKNL